MVIIHFKKKKNTRIKKKKCDYKFPSEIQKALQIHVLFTI